MEEPVMVARHDVAVQAPAPLEENDGEIVSPAIMACANEPRVRDLLNEAKAQHYSDFILHKLSITPSSSSQRLAITLNDGRFFDLVYLRNLPSVFGVLSRFIPKPDVYGDSNLVIDFHMEIGNLYPGNASFPVIFDFVKELNCSFHLEVFDSVLNLKELAHVLGLSSNRLTLLRCSTSDDINTEKMIAVNSLNIDISDSSFALCEKVLLSCTKNSTSIRSIDVRGADTGRLQKSWSNIVYRSVRALKKSILAFQITFDPDNAVYFSRALWKNGYIGENDFAAIYDTIMCIRRKPYFPGVMDLHYSSVLRTVRLMIDGEAVSTVSSIRESNKSSRMSVCSQSSRASTCYDRRKTLGSSFVRCVPEGLHPPINEEHATEEESEGSNDEEGGGLYVSGDFR